MRRHPRVICTHIYATMTCEKSGSMRRTRGLSVHTILLPRPVRSQVACGDIQGLSAHTNTIMLPQPMRIG